MKRALFFWIAVTWLLTAPVHAQMTFGVAPNQNSLIRSEEEAELFNTYVEKRLDKKITLRLFKNEDALYQELRRKKVDYAVISNVFYREHAGGVQLLANFTRSEGKTHRLLLIVSKNSPVRSIDGLKTRKRTLVLDERSRSRISFLTGTVKGDPEKVFKRISVSPQVIDTLHGLVNGTYDAACVEDGLLETVQRFDPGLTRQIRTLKTSKPFASDPIVSRKGLPPNYAKNIKELLLDMESDSDGQQILLGMRITRFLPPVTQRSLYPENIDPSQYRQPPKKKIETATTKELAPASAKKVPETPPPTTAVKEAVQKKEKVAPAPKPEKETAKAVSEIVRKESKESEESAVGKGKAASEKTAEAGPVQEEVEKVHYSIFTMGGSIILFVLFLIVLFLIMRRKGEQVEGALKAAHSSETGTEELSVQADAAAREIHQVTDGPNEKPAKNMTDVPFGKVAKTSLVELRGELKTFRVPDLLQLMASCRNTGALVIRSKHDEKCLYFRGGKICAASCFDKDNKNKLGYLLIKMGLITEKERARALAMCAEDPSKRLGKALMEIGAVRKEDIREVLRLQAQEIVYSIYVYPEGRFEFIDEEPVVDPEEDLSLDVMNLLMEGARREDEWDKMRQAIPSMDIILKFSEERKGKLNGSELNRDQELVLSMINGEKSVREICVKSTMVDFEVCNFLYKLIKLSVLEKVEVSSQKDEKKLK